MFWQTIQPAILILSLGLAVVVIIVLLKAVSYPRRLLRKRDETSAKEETVILDEIYRKLNRLENRIESLETIVVETQREPR